MSLLDQVIHDVFSGGRSADVAKADEQKFVGLGHDGSLRALRLILTRQFSFTEGEIQLRSNPLAQTLSRKPTQPPIAPASSSGVNQLPQRTYSVWVCRR